MLLSTPLPLLKPPSSRLLSRSFALFPVSLPSHCSQPARLPSRLRSIGKWPEWEKMVECVESLNSEDDFAEDVPEDFAAAARSCLLFARLRPDLLRSLSKRDIEIIVDNSSPFLFKNAHGSIHRMNAFIREKNDLGNKSAYTVDLMKYLVTCVYHHHHRGFSEEERNPGNLVESSARILLHELTQLNNSKNKLGSLRQLTGTEWECPQCQFFNNPRNASCLRCDFSRPGNEISESNKAPDVEERNETLESEISLKLDRILGRLSSPEEEVNEFSETMPMRKGENRFVISKKKDRSLTSPQYKRRAAMDQAASSNFVPFVPFPPGYFAKDNDNNNGNDNSNDNGNDDEGKGADEERWKVNEKEEADRKDMSEEAKAERWFKRAAQINDISELSNIPDEDFPEIMPMRKGVNRFVVSKRKTPLERRLTSPQRRSGLSQEKSTSGIPFSDEEQ